MLRRHNSNRLTRRKSTSSVQSKHEPMDPEVARRHAHVAATLAFARAQERRMADEHSKPSQTAPVLRRQQSVRFAGPHAHHRNSTSEIKHSQIVSQPSIQAHLQPIALTTNTPVPAIFRPPSRSSSIGKGFASRTLVDDLAAVDAFDVHHTREDDIASTPSSYRRIRRSKSMFSPLKAPNIFYNNGTPERHGSSLSRKKSFLGTSRRSQDQENRPVLRAPKSMIFHGDQHVKVEVPQVRNDLAVQLARDRFFNQTTQQRLREQPSFVFRSNAQRQERPFRKSVRSSSTNSYGPPIASKENEPLAKDSNLKEAARKASRSLRSKFKRVLGWSDRGEPVEIPNQQVFAKETHVRQYLGDLSVDNHQFPNLPRPAEASLSRVSTRLPSLHNQMSSQQLRSHAGSVRSARSTKSAATDYSDDKSRVTSWTSTGVNTIESHSARLQVERELQRLSIIKENGTHISSSSFKRPQLQNQFSAYPLVEMRNQQNAPGLNSGPVDSARVYSALMKRIGTSDEGTYNSIHARQQSDLKHTLKANAIKQVYRSRSQATIRRVTPDDSTEPVVDSQSGGHGDGGGSSHDNRVKNTFPSQPDHIVDHWVTSASPPQNQIGYAGDVYYSKSSVSNKENIASKPHNGNKFQGSGVSRQASTKTLSYVGPEHSVLTPQEMACRNEPILPSNRVLRDSRSTFFGGTSAFAISRTPSPFRRALAESDRNCQPAHIIQEYSTRRNSPLRNPLLGSNTTAYGSEDVFEPEAAYSESVYSRTTSGQTPGQGMDSSNFDFDSKHKSSTGGDAIIINRMTYRPTIPARREHNVSSSAGSVEWQKWMSSEVAKLERSKDITATTPYVNYALPTMPKSYNPCHVREKTQITDDETDITEPSTTVLEQAQTSVQVSSNPPPLPFLRPILKNRSVSSLGESTLTGDERIAEINPPPPPPPAPPLPPSLSRLPVRRAPSRSSISSTIKTPILRVAVNAPASAPNLADVKNSTVLHKRNKSTPTLRSMRIVETPGKLIKRNGRSPNVSPRRSPIVGISLQRDNQFGSNSSRSRSPGRLAGNLSTEQEVKYKIHEGDGATLIDSELMRSGVGEVSEREAQSIGSKRMVDLFLSSRRRRIASASDDGASRVFL